ncbi:hypothetical protein LB503_011850 [Fusarium chuoi]|nr:hypothetical protein LB503_011850 [Fusarium chuoi]
MAHLMTGLGVNYFITWGIWLRHCLNGSHDQYILHWPQKLLSLPSVVPSLQHRRDQNLQHATNVALRDFRLEKKEL